jgi:hypothetical protein
MYYAYVCKLQRRCVVRSVGCIKIKGAFSSPLRAFLIIKLILHVVTAPKVTQTVTQKSRLAEISGLIKAIYYYIYELQST